MISSAGLFAWHFAGPVSGAWVLDSPDQFNLPPQVHMLLLH